MIPSRPDNAAIFHAARDIPDPDRRREYVRQGCGGDESRIAHIEALLAAAEAPDSLLDRAAASDPAATIDMPATVRPGTVIGAYKLIEPIGEGGMGSVWMAQQHEPVKRLVAVKLIKAGMDSKQVIARFEAERQALALMDHPNIARVLEGGATVAGRPYFVMDLVRGVPITRYCDEHHLTPRARLELFIPVCQAVQHAHQKGIIHRDLKPSNVLVALYDGKPVPKVIDFGVAKATGQALTDKTLVTGLGNIVGTLEYMSPEQAEVDQLDIDTRSDIYSLGVLLYELLAGSPPFSRKELEKAGMLEMLRVIREQEPSKPSTKLNSSDALPSLSANRGTEPARLTKLVRGELDWIVMKALEKDRSRRYETANGFAMDVQRYLADEAVQACPPSARYRFRKFARRNRSALVTVFFVAIALLIGSAISVWQAVRATRAEEFAKVEARRASHEAERAIQESKRANEAANNARTEAAIAKAVNDFLNDDLLAQASPFLEPDREIKLRTLVERAAEKIDSRFRNQPLVEASIRQTLGYIYASLADSRKAEEQYQRALEIRRRNLGAEHPDTLWSKTQLATTFNAQNRHKEAETLLGEVFAVNKRDRGPEHPSTLISLTRLADCRLSQGGLADAEKVHREVYEIRRRVLGPEHPDTLRSKFSIALAMKRQGRNAEAENLYREVLEIRIRVLPSEHPAVLATMALLANAIRDQNRLSEAEELYRKVYDVQRRVLGPQHPSTLLSMKYLGDVLERQGRHVEARPLWDGALIQSKQGLDFQKTGRLKEAADCFRQAISSLENLAEEFPTSREYRMELGRCYIWLCDATGESKEKGVLLHRSLSHWEKLADDFPMDSWIWSELGSVHGVLGQWQQAADAHTKALELNPQFGVAWERRGWACTNLGRWKEAVAYHTKALEFEPKLWYAWWGRGYALAKLNRWSDALADTDRAIELGGTFPEIWVFKAAAFARLEQPDKAMAELNQAIAKGFRDAQHLQSREDLSSLRDRDDFKKLLTDLHEKNKQDSR